MSLAFRQRQLAMTVGDGLDGIFQIMFINSVAHSNIWCKNPVCGLTKYIFKSPVPQTQTYMSNCSGITSMSEITCMHQCLQNLVKNIQVIPLPIILSVFIFRKHVPTEIQSSSIFIDFFCLVSYHLHKLKLKQEPFCPKV